MHDRVLPIDGQLEPRAHRQQARYVGGLKTNAEVLRAREHEELPAKRDVNRHGARLAPLGARLHARIDGDLQRHPQMHSKRRDILDGHGDHLARLASRFHAHEADGGLQGHRRHRLDHRDASGLEQRGHRADRVAARHRRESALLHNNDRHIGPRVRGRERKHRAQPRIATGLVKHETSQAMELARGVGEAFFD